MLQRMVESFSVEDEKTYAEVSHASYSEKLYGLWSLSLYYYYYISIFIQKQTNRRFEHQNVGIMYLIIKSHVNK